MFALDQAITIERELDGIDAIVLAAGPFSATSAPVVDACLATGTHYLDITGEIDVMNRVDRKTANLLARNEGIVIQEATGTQHYTIPMNTTVAPFDNNDVRLALKFAIKRDELLKRIPQGAQRPRKRSPHWPL